MRKKEEEQRTQKHTHVRRRRNATNALFYKLSSFSLSSSVLVLSTHKRPEPLNKRVLFSLRICIETT